MKRLIIAFSIAALAMPLFAQDKPNTTTTVLAQPSAPTQQDSPLVRAAKATNRLNKKPGRVITNETLAQSGGHMATSNVTTNPMPTPALSTASESDISSARGQAESKAKRDAAAAKLQRLKSNPDDYMRENDVPPPVTAMSPTQPAVTSTSQVPAATNSQPASMSTSAPAPATTSQVTQMKPAQPETANTTKPPQ